MKPKNEVILVGKLISEPKETPNGVMATIMTDAVSYGGKAFEERNFIECNDDTAIERLSGCNVGDCLAVVGKLRTEEKVTRIIVDHLEKCGK